MTNIVSVQTTKALGPVVDLKTVRGVHKVKRLIHDHAV